MHEHKTNSNGKESSFEERLGAERLLEVIREMDMTELFS